MPASRVGCLKNKACRMGAHSWNEGQEWILFLSGVKGVMDNSIPDPLASVSLSGHWWGLGQVVLLISSILGYVAHSCQSGLLGEAGDLSL